MKIDKANVAKIAGIASAVIAAVVAFAGEVASQKEKARIDDMDNRIAALEKREERDS